MKIIAPPEGAYLATTHGAIFNLGPNEELNNAPPFLAALAVEKGCSVIRDGAKVQEAPPVMTEDERRAKIAAAVLAIVNESDPKKMTNGTPRVNAVAEVVGFDVKKEEITAAYEVLTADGN